MAHVVELGAICDLGVAVAGFSQDFRVSEYLILDTGERIVLEDERGFTTAAFVDGARIQSQAVETRESLTASILNVVLPDDDTTGDAHPWDWLAELAHARGVAVTADELRDVPYRIRMTPQVEAWLSNAADQRQTH